MALFSLEYTEMTALLRLKILRDLENRNGCHSTIKVRRLFLILVSLNDTNITIRH